MYEIKFRAWDKNHKEMTYITDLYWFEQEGVHDGGGNGHYANYELMPFIGISDKNNKDIYDGDILKVPVRRVSASYSNWWQETNENHGWTGDYVYRVVKKISPEESDRIYGSIGGFSIYSLPITKIQKDKIAKPRGKERDEQAVDDLNVSIKQCEVIGNIYENPELLGMTDGE